MARKGRNTSKPNGKFALSNWRKRRNEGIDKVLPSGLAVKVRQINIMQILADELLPPELRPELTRVLQQNVDGGLNEEDMAGYSEMLRGVFSVVVMHPKVVDSYAKITDSDNEMGQEEIDVGDALAVLTWANTLGELTDAAQ